MILKVATVLFLVNVTVYMVFHRGMDAFMADGSVAIEQSENVNVHQGHDH